MKTHWIWYGDTGVFLVEHPYNLIPEWHVRGTVIRRQVYESEPPRWYAMIGGGGVVESTLLGRFDCSNPLSRDEAERTVERAVLGH